ncbi:unnamed protein product [Microthlaspi erraticum]|uniref:Uncharacterized protein n=1 Tax=Microthlaspi erraticum TaxID=1685480 RepID=A0A6D2K615_9BRAS|nr:unnamed protein product [Microthlaspi erraticum]
MIRVEEDSSVSIPTDLVVEILSRLPAASVSRFRCLAKQWEAMLISPYFIELFRTRSSARPRLLFVLQRDSGEWCCFTSPHPKIPYEKSSSSLVVTADSHMKFIGDDKIYRKYYRHASGLICFRRSNDRCPVICNPITGEYMRLSLPSRQMENGIGGNHFEFCGEAKCRGVKIFVDHVEDLNFINMKTAFGYDAISTSPPEQKRKPTTTSTSSAKARQFVSFNKFDSLCLSDDDEFT